MMGAAIDRGFYDPDSRSGWVAVNRSDRFHDRVGMGKPVKPADAKRGAYSRFEAWTDLKMMACHSPSEWMNKGRRAKLGIGQLGGGYSFLAARWNWTVKTVRNFLVSIAGDGLISKESDSHSLVGGQSDEGKQKSNCVQTITICDYRVFSVASEIDTMIEGQAKGKRGASEGQDSRTSKQTYPSEATPLQDIPDRQTAAEGDLTPDRLVWGNCAKWLAQKTGKTDRAVKGVIGRWLKVLTFEELLDAFRSARRTGVDDPVPYISAIVSRAEKTVHERCRRENGRLVVVNGFKAELEQILGGRDLQRTLDRINGSIPQSAVGVDLESKIRSEAIKLIDIELDWNRRHKPQDVRVL